MDVLMFWPPGSIWSALGIRTLTGATSEIEHFCLDSRYDFEVQSILVDFHSLRWLYIKIQLKG